LNQYEGYLGLFNLEYRKYGNMSNLREYYMLWLEPEMLFADITWEKPNISQLHIH